MKTTKKTGTIRNINFPAEILTNRQIGTRLTNPYEIGKSTQYLQQIGTRMNYERHRYLPLVSPQFPEPNFDTIGNSQNPELSEY